MMSNEKILQIIKKDDINILSKKLNIARGTILRWLELKHVPKNYYFEIFKFYNIDIDYSKYSYKDKDQFFTPENIAKHCYNVLLDKLIELKENEKDYYFIEPSSGSGNFLRLLPENRRIGLDIEPKNKEILEQDYLTWKPQDDNRKYIVIGNPPFGLRGQLALKFINHSYYFADYVSFILPQLFESDGKGVPRKRVMGYNLIHSQKIKTYFLYPDGGEVNISCIFQIWSKYHSDDKYKIQEVNSDEIKIYSLSDGGTSSTTRNKKMFKKCDIFLPSTCFGKENMKFYNNFEDLPGRKGYGLVFLKNKEYYLEKFKNINWEDISFLSTNSAYNIRSSQILKELI